MAQHDYDIANGTGAAVRSDINNGLAAIVSNNSGTSEPATMYAYQWWADTTTGLLKIRNAANNAWVTVGTLADANLGLLTSGSTLTAALGSASTPGITFTGDLNTGIFSPGADQVAISTNGTGRLFVDASGNVGLGSTSSPGALLDLAANTETGSNTLRFTDTDTLTVADQQIGKIEFYSADASSPGAGVKAYIGAFATDTSPDAYIAFATDNGGTLGERVRITNTGAVGIGDNAPDSTLTIKAATSVVPLRVSGPSSEFARIDTSGRLLVGTSSARGVSTSTNSLLQAETTSYMGLSLINNTNDNGGVGLALGKSRGTTSGSINIVQSGDDIGAIFFAGADGVDLESPAASIKCSVDGTPGADDMPGRLVFSTTADGASSPTERMRIDSAGQVGIGRAPTAALDVYRASGQLNVICDSDSLGNSENSAFAAVGGPRNAAVGVYKHSGITNPAGYVNLQAEDAAQNYSWVDNSDQLRISTTVTHIGTTSGTVVGTQTSDERIKNILGPVTYGLDEIKQLDPVSYALKSDPEQVPHLGFIAQQVLPLVPESVFDTDEVIEEGEPTKLGMEYVALIPVLVNAIKELSAENESLKARLDAAGI